MTYRLFGILLLFFSPVASLASEIMFEGYYRVELEGKPIGYTILRYEFEPKTKIFEAKSFLRVKFGDKIVQESTKAKATDKFKPVSYQYTSQVGDEIKAIDASFTGEVMKVNFSDGKKTRTENSKIPKGTFLSSFLPYLMLQQKLEIGQNFQYSAVAEEDGASYNGKAMMQSKEAKPGYELFSVLNRFKGEEFISKMAIIKDAKTGKNVKGEVFATVSPAKNLSTRLMGSAVQATEGMIVPNKTLLTVFGGIPTGKINMVADPASLKNAGAEEPTEPGPANIASPVPPEPEPEAIIPKAQPEVKLKPKTGQ